MQLFGGLTVLRFDVTVPANYQQGVAELRARVHYESCTNEVCFPPTDGQVRLPIAVVGANTSVKQITANASGAKKGMREVFPNIKTGNRPVYELVWKLHGVAFVNTKLATLLFSLLLMAGAAGELCGAAALLAAATPRDPHGEGYVTAKELPDGTLPPAEADGNFIIGPTHPRAAEMTAQEGVPQGTIFQLTMQSTDSKIYPGIAREPRTFGTPDPNNPAKLIVTTSHPAPYTRRVAVYVPKQYVAGTAAPFMVGADGPDPSLFTALDNLIAQHKVPVMVAISIGNGSGDAQGSERGLEYDTMSGRYAEFVEKEVLPLVEAQCHVKLTKDPEGRATMGCSSGAACAMIMAWYHPKWYHRVLSYSGTFVNQQWPSNPKTPGGAWELHEHLIPKSRTKPLRIWLEVGDRDLLNPNVMRDNMHDWVLANEHMARALAAKGYHYQFIFARSAGHCDGAVKQQTLPEALEYVWQGYPIAGATGPQ